MGYNHEAPPFISAFREFHMHRFAGVIVVALLASGCLRSTTVISVKPDGSGTVVQETGVSPQALAMLQGMASSSSEPGKMPTELFGEEQAKKAAATMGIQFVSGEPIKTAQVEGYRARFAFDDVRKLRMKMNQDPTKEGSATTSGGDSPFGFDFERRDASSVLTIVMPDKTDGAAAINPMNGLGMGGSNPDAQANQQAMQMMKVMMQGLFVDITLNVDGRIIKTNAPHVNGSQLTLMQLDFDKLLADEAAMQKLQGAKDLKSLASVPGLKVIADKKVTVEFAR
jgi:hypothetical protein